MPWSGRSWLWWSWTAAPLDDNDRMVLHAAQAVGRPSYWRTSPTCPRRRICPAWSGRGSTCCPSAPKRPGAWRPWRRRSPAASPPAPNSRASCFTNARQAEAAGRAEQALAAVQSGLEAGMPLDAVLSDVECALAALGEISGRRVTEDVTSRIFSRFCVGK